MPAEYAGEEAWINQRLYVKDRNIRSETGSGVCIRRQKWGQLGGTCVLSFRNLG